MYAHDAQTCAALSAVSAPRSAKGAQRVPSISKTIMLSGRTVPVSIRPAMSAEAIFPTPMKPYLQRQAAVSLFMQRPSPFHDIKKVTQRRAFETEAAGIADAGASHRRLFIIVQTAAFFKSKTNKFQKLAIMPVYYVNMIM